MNEQPEVYRVTRERLGCIEERIRSRLTGRVRDLQLVAFEQGVVLRGHAPTYYAKQLAQQVVIETNLPIVANEIEVFGLEEK